jgi:transposase-like protein
MVGPVVETTAPGKEETTMTRTDVRSPAALAKEAMLAEGDLLKAAFRRTLQEILESEMTDALGARKSERTLGRLGYRSGYYERDLVTRFGKIELRTRPRAIAPRRGLSG